MMYTLEYDEKFLSRMMSVKRISEMFDAQECKRGECYAYASAEIADDIANAICREHGVHRGHIKIVYMSA